MHLCVLCLSGCTWCRRVEHLTANTIQEEPQCHLCLQAPRCSSRVKPTSFPSLSAGCSSVSLALLSLYKGIDVVPPGSAVSLNSSSTITQVLECSCHGVFCVVAVAFRVQTLPCPDSLDKVFGSFQNGVTALKLRQTYTIACVNVAFIPLG